MRLMKFGAFSGLLILAFGAVAGCGSSGGSDPRSASALAMSGWYLAHDYDKYDPNEDAFNLKLEGDGPTYTGVWTWKLDDAVTQRGTLTATVGDGHAEIALVQDEPCVGQYACTGTASNGRMSLSVSGGDCSDSLVFTVLLCKFEAGCSTSGGGSGGGPPPAPITKLGQLGGGVVCADLRIIPPVGLEERKLRADEAQRLLRVARTGLWTNWMGPLTSRVGVCRAAPYHVLDNMLVSLNGAGGGGLAMTSWFSVDGKFLDILWDWAAFRALRENGLTQVSVLGAADLIVNHYVPLLNTTGGGRVFNTATQSAAVQARARAIFEGLAGFITYHEFGHVWGRHTLLRLRAQNGVISSTILFTSAGEDDADETSGMLLAKSGYDATYSLEALDLMYYYIKQWSTGGWTFAQVLTSFVQNQGQGQHASLARRKQLVQLGMARMAQHLGSPKPFLTTDVPSVPDPTALEKTRLREALQLAADLRVLGTGR